MRTSRSVIIIGGGAIGVEIAQLMNNVKIETTSSMSDNILNRYLDKELGRRRSKNSGFERGLILSQTLLWRISKKKQSKILHVHEGNVGKTISRVLQEMVEFVADGVIYATGFRPNTFLASEQLELW